MDTCWTEITVLLCLFVGNLVFGNFPSLLCKLVGSFSNSEDECQRRIKLSTFFLYVGAGIFISDSFVVLLPKTNYEFTKSSHHSREQNESSTEQHKEYHHDSVPIPEFIILCSFFLAYIGQEIIFYTLTKLNRTSMIFVDKTVSYCSCAKRHTECSRTFKDVKAEQTLYGLEKKLQESGLIPNAAAVEVDAIPEATETAKSELLRSSILAQPVPNYGAVTNVTNPVIDSPLPVLPSPVLLHNERRISVEQNIAAKYQNKFLINGILITVALTLQYIFLGIHLGVEAQGVHPFSHLFMQCLQNFILNFSVGSYLEIGNMKFFYSAIIIGLLSLISPIGLIVGIIEKTILQEVPRIAKGIVFGITCGILLYTIFCGILRQKIPQSITGLTKFLAVLLGASIMISLQYVTSIL